MLYREFVARLLDSQAYYLILSLDQSKTRQRAKRTEDDYHDHHITV